MIKLGENTFFELKEIAEQFSVDLASIEEVLMNNHVKIVEISNIKYVLESEFVKMFSANQLESTIIRTRHINAPITEKEILVKTIELLKINEKLTISQLRQMLKDEMTLTEEDLTVLKNRNDTKFDQKVRNLIAHRGTNDLDKYCTYHKNGKNSFLTLRADYNY